MSGGSFNYLCHREPNELMVGGLGDMEEMVDALAGVGYAPDAAKETVKLIAEVRAAEARLEALTERLRPVWRAMEWWTSGDTGEADFKAALAKYRGVDVPACSRCGGTGRERESVVACQNPGCAGGKDTAGV